MLTYASSALLATAYASRLCSSPPSRRCPISVPLHTFFYILKKNYIKKKINGSRRCNCIAAQCRYRYICFLKPLYTAIYVSSYFPHTSIRYCIHVSSHHLRVALVLEKCFSSQSTPLVSATIASQPNLGTAIYVPKKKKSVTKQ
jgi:hypothetical protein